MANDTEATVDLSGIRAFDCVRSLAVAVMFIVMTFYDRRTWLLCDTIGATLMGAFHLVWPHIYMQQYIGEDDMDEIMYYVTRVFAGFLFASGIYRFLVRKSRDELTIASFVWSRFMVLSLLLTFGFYLSTSKKFYIRKGQFGFVMFGTVLWLVSTLVQLVRYVNPQGGLQKSGLIITILRADVFVSFIFGLVHLSFPGWLLGFQIRQPKLFHRYLVRLVGTLLLGSSFEGQQAISFRYDVDRTSYFLCRVLTYALVAVSMALGYLYHGLFNLRELTMASLFFVSTLPCLLGLIVSLSGQGATRKPESYSSSYTSGYYTRSKKIY